MSRPDAVRPSCAPHIAAQIANADQIDPPVITTFHIKNVLPDCTRDSIVSVLNEYGFERRYDLIYLPIKFDTGEHMGYAFVNFVSPGDAEVFKEEFPIFYGQICDDGQPCTINNGKMQGLERLIEGYRNSPIMHESIPKEYQPMMFEEGILVDFPPPTKEIQPHKPRRDAACNQRANREANGDHERSRPSKAPRRAARGPNRLGPSAEPRVDISAAPWRV
mmetsp:Transcript_6091/g.11653  ORF Transcript_6091/g.11653 Transcript_6091/m.11653 type:complete len:220 (-) Transcript_6091:70-729(-)